MEQTPKALTRAEAEAGRALGLKQPRGWAGAALAAGGTKSGQVRSGAQVRLHQGWGQAPPHPPPAHQRTPLPRPQATSRGPRPQSHYSLLLYSGEGACTSQPRTKSAEMNIKALMPGARGKKPRLQSSAGGLCTGPCMSGPRLLISPSSNPSD